LYQENGSKTATRYFIGDIALIFFNSQHGKLFGKLFFSGHGGFFGLRRLQ